MSSGVASTDANRLMAACQPDLVKHGSITTLFWLVGPSFSGQISVTVQACSLATSVRSGARGRLPSWRINHSYRASGLDISLASRMVAKQPHYNEIAGARTPKA